MNNNNNNNKRKAEYDLQKSNSDLSDIEKINQNKEKPVNKKIKLDNDKEKPIKK